MTADIQIVEQCAYLSCHDDAAYQVVLEMRTQAGNALGKTVIFYCCEHHKSGITMDTLISKAVWDMMNLSKKRNGVRQASRKQSSLRFDPIREGESQS